MTDSEKQVKLIHYSFYDHNSRHFLAPQCDIVVLREGLIFKATKV